MLCKFGLPGGLAGGEDGELGAALGGLELGGREDGGIEVAGTWAVFLNLRMGSGLSSSGMWGAMPETPDWSECQRASGVLPMGVRQPRPVMTTRCIGTGYRE